MDFKQYLIDTFQFNDQANKAILQKIMLLPEKKEAVRLFNHLTNSQFKWLARILHDSRLQEMDWWLPDYELHEMESKWEESLQQWLHYLDGMTESELLKEVEFIGMEEKRYAATPGDIALQLNYHSIHHRAQITRIVREQGFAPDFTDYIRTKFRKIQDDQNG